MTVFTSAAAYARNRGYIHARIPPRTPAPPQWQNLRYAGAFNLQFAQRLLPLYSLCLPLGKRNRLACRLALSGDLTHG
jgi:hypothetical protein